MKEQRVQAVHDEALSTESLSVDVLCETISRVRIT